MIEVEGYRNFNGVLLVGVRRQTGAHYYDSVMSCAEAKKLRDDLNAILETIEPEKETKP